MVVFERGCNLLQIVPVGISGTILACRSVGGNNSICMNFQLIQNLVSTPVKMTQINYISRNRLHNIARSCQNLNFGLIHSELEWNFCAGYSWE